MSQSNEGGLVHPGERLVQLHASEVWSKGNFAVLGEIFHADTVNHLAPLGLPPGIEGIRMLVSGAREIIPDLSLTIHEIAAAGDTLFTRGEFRGTHLGGVHYGFAPTGRSLRWNVLAMFRYREGRFSEEWAISDELEIVRRLAQGKPLAALQSESLPRRRNSLLD